METCDVLVVGGGPAGSSCAWRLRESGFDVLVMDRARFPRDKPCAGWVTPQVFDALRLSPADYAGGRLRETRFDAPVSYGILRREFDAFLLERSGARVVAETPASSFERTPSGWLVNGEVKTRLLVGAGGHFCPVARHLGARVGTEHAVTAQEIETEVAEGELDASDVPPGVPELSFCRDLRGYGWVFRKGKHLNVGFGREADRDVPRATKAFLEEERRSGRVPVDFGEAWKGHASLLYDSSRRRIYDDGVVLVGDAAGLAYRESGEGIRTAVESGLLAADAALEAEGDFRRESLARYGRRIEERFGRRREERGFPAPSVLSRLLAPLVLALPSFRRRLLLERGFLRSGVPSLG